MYSDSGEVNAGSPCSASRAMPLEESHSVIYPSNPPGKRFTEFRYFLPGAMGRGPPIENLELEIDQGLILRNMSQVEITDNHRYSN